MLEILGLHHEVSVRRIPKGWEELMMAVQLPAPVGVQVVAGSNPVAPTLQGRSIVAVSDGAAASVFLPAVSAGLAQ